LVNSGLLFGRVLTSGLPMKDQIRLRRCARLGTKSIIIPLFVFVIIVLQSQAVAAHVVGAASTRLLSEPNRVFAQAGSTGAFVAKQGKSISGGQDTDQPRRTERARPRRTEGVSSPSSERKQRQSRAKASSPVRYDGTWSGVSTGTCIGQYKWTVQVHNGIMSGSGADGRISPDGAANGIMTSVLGTRYDFRGHLSLSQASGTWTRPDGCSGNWTATKT
jgi:hypothetical protein